MINHNYRYLDKSDAKVASDVITKIIRNQQMYSNRAREEECQKYLPSKIEEMLSRDKKAIMIAESHSEISGFISTSDDDHLRWISWFGVQEHFRHMGVAQTLLERSIDDFSGSYWKLWCDTRTINVPSNNLLEKLGFKTICKIERHWYGQDFYLWQKFI